MKTLLLTLTWFAVALCGCQSSGNVAANQNVGQTITPTQASRPAMTGSSPPDVVKSANGETNPALPGAALPPNVKASKPAKSSADSDATVIKEFEIPVNRKELEQNNKLRDKALQSQLQIPANNTSDWKPTSVTAELVFSVLSSRTRGIENVLGHFLSTVKNPDGSGTFDQFMKVKDAFVYDMPFIDDEPDHPGSEYPTLASRIVSNGKFKMELMGTKWQHRLLLAARFPDLPMSAEKIALTMDRNFTRYLFAGITDNVDVWRTAFEEWKKGVGGYDITSEERTVPVDKYHIKQYRVHLIRNAEAAKKLGNSEMEIIVDAAWGLPVGFGSTTSSPGSTKGNPGAWQIRWGAAYFRETGSYFTPKDFVAPFDKAN